MKYGNLLTLKEVETLINNVPNLDQFKGKRPTKLTAKGYQVMLKLLYHGMFTPSEIINIKKKDVDYNNKMIKNVIAKGDRKTAVIFTSENLWPDILEHMKELNDDDELFPITRQRLWEITKIIGQVGEYSKIKVEHATKSTDNPYPNLLRNSRENHLKLTRIFRESELERLCRKNPKIGTRSPTDVNLDKLKNLEKEANEFLRTFCDDCEYWNPHGANFCCRCGNSVKIGKSIL